MRRQALGRGIGALIPTAPPRSKPLGKADPEVPSGPPEIPSGQVLNLPIDAIEVNPRQPRTHFDPSAIEELAASIAEKGVLQPILVRTGSGGQFELIAGERRFRASQAAGLSEIPALVREMADEESLVVALVENVQRADLGALEEAHAYQALMNEFDLTQEEVAKRVGKSRPSIANTLRLLALPDAAQEELAAGRLTAGHARALLAVEGEAAQKNLAREIVTRKLSVRDTEKAASKLKGAARSKPKPKQDPDVRRVEDDLTRVLGTKVTLQTSRGGSGRIEIEYYSDEDLERVVEVITKPKARSASGR